MTERLHEFKIGDRPGIDFRLGSGDLRISEGDARKITITLRGSDRTLQTIDVQQHGDTVTVASRKKTGFLPRLDVGVVVPRGATVRAKLASMDLVVEVPLDQLTGSVASGDVTIGEVESDVDLHSASGDIRIGRIGGNAKIAAASGDIRIDEIEGDATIKSGSGDIDVARVRGGCECKTASGDIIVRAFEGRSFQSSALAGDVVLGLPPGRTLDVSLQTLAGDVRNEFDVARDEGITGEATLDIKTMSGDIVLRPAGQ